MTKRMDDLEAVRSVVDVLQRFDAAVQRRIIRWAAEKLDLPLPFAPDTSVGRLGRGRAAARVPGAGARASALPRSSLRAFIAAKRPRNDTEFAATVAHYAAAVAPAGQKKAGIRAEDLVAACIEAGRKPPPVPGQTLRNARAAGILASKMPGIFSASAAGRKLVVETLPRDAGAGRRPARRRRRGTASARARRRSRGARRRTAGRG